MNDFLESLERRPLLGIIAPALGKLADYIIEILTDSVLMEVLGSLSLIVGLSVGLLAGISHFLTIREKLIRAKNRNYDNDRRR